MIGVAPLFLAECSEVAYAVEEEIASWLKGRGWKLERFISRNDTEVFVATKGKDAVIAFRGTEPTHIVDIMADANAKKQDWVFGRIHSGFAKALGYVWKDVYDICDELHTQGVKLFVTGHSLGAALAVLLAARFAFADMPVELTTFGCPRVGDGRFAAYVNEAVPGHERWVNNSDVVTRLPLSANWITNAVPFGWLLPAGFKHSGRLRYITASGDIIDEPSKWRLSVDRLKGRWFAGRHFLTDGSRDHSVQNYVDLLA